MDSKRRSPLCPQRLSPQRSTRNRGVTSNERLLDRETSGVGRRVSLVFGQSSTSGHVDSTEMLNNEIRNILEAMEGPGSITANTYTMSARTQSVHQELPQPLISLHRAHERENEHDNDSDYDEESFAESTVYSASVQSLIQVTVQKTPTRSVHRTASPGVGKGRSILTALPIVNTPVLPIMTTPALPDFETKQRLPSGGRTDRHVRPRFRYPQYIDSTTSDSMTDQSVVYMENPQLHRKRPVAVDPTIPCLSPSSGEAGINFEDCSCTMDGSDADALNSMEVGVPSSLSRQSPIHRHLHRCQAGMEDPVHALRTANDAISIHNQENRMPTGVDGVLHKCPKRKKREEDQEWADQQEIHLKTHNLEQSVSTTHQDNTRIILGNLTPITINNKKKEITEKFRYQQAGTLAEYETPHTADRVQNIFQHGDLTKQKTPTTPIKSSKKKTINKMMSLVSSPTKANHGGQKRPHEYYEMNMDSRPAGSPKRFTFELIEPPSMLPQCTQCDSTCIAESTKVKISKEMRKSPLTLLCEKFYPKTSVKTGVEDLINPSIKVKQCNKGTSNPRIITKDQSFHVLKAAPIAHSRQRGAGLSEKNDEDRVPIGSPKKQPVPRARPGAGTIHAEPVPERIDVYYFDHGNARYLRTTDQPPVIMTEMIAEQTDYYATRFWAEIFGSVHIGFAFLTAFILQFFRFVLYSMVRPLTVGILQLFSDYFFKPFLTIFFNGLIQPILIFLYNIATSMRDLIEPITEALSYVTRAVAILFKSLRLVDVNVNPRNMNKTAYGETGNLI